MTARTLPTVWRLTPDERDGKRCIWCGVELGADAIPAGIAIGYWGAHNRSVRVDSCPDCSLPSDGGSRA